jgi:hypothetical protein
VPIIDRHAGKKVAENGMVPFSFNPALSYLRVMEKTFFDHRSMEAGSLALEMGCPFLRSCFPYFNLGSGFLSLLCASAPLWPNRPFF